MYTFTGQHLLLVDSLLPDQQLLQRALIASSPPLRRTSVWDRKEELVGEHTSFLLSLDLRNDFFNLSKIQTLECDANHQCAAAIK